MKRPLLVLLFAGVIVAGITGGRPEPAPERPAEALGCNLPLLMGDVNGTEEVAANDALWVLRHNARLLLPYPLCSPVDVDCNGLVNSVDALKILRFVCGPGGEPN